MPLPRYHLDRLIALARGQLAAEGRAPDSLDVYHRVARLRGEECRLHRMAMLPVVEVRTVAEPEDSTALVRVAGPRLPAAVTPA